MATTTPDQRPVITAREWKKHKPHILNLYVKENWPLRMVRKELADEGFEPRHETPLSAMPGERSPIACVALLIPFFSSSSESQYRTRFKKWRIHKNRKSKTTKEIATTSSNKPEQRSSTIATEAPGLVLPLTIER